MFELPVVITNKRIRSKRKLRYQYINTLNKKHEQLNPEKQIVGLPTPESSAAETSDTDELEDSQSKRTKRRKRRLQSILGHAVSSSDEDDISEEENDDDYEECDYEKHVKSKYYKPQETYELWTTGPENRVPLNTTSMTYKQYKKIHKAAHRRVTRTLSYSSKNSAAFFSAIYNGYEPYEISQLENYQTTHIRNLTNLLHINVMEQNWEIAYRCFSILIRLPGVDIRSIWGIGVRILKEIDRKKSEEFLEWMSSVFSTKNNFNQGTNHAMDPVFRSGSKTHTPKFVTTWLWETLMGCTSKDENNGNRDMNKLQFLTEKISELVLTPPYMDDPKIWFIYALCHIIEADHLSQQFVENEHIKNGSRRDIARNQVIQHITNAKNFLQTCQEKGGFQFPKQHIEKQLSNFENRLYQRTEDLLNNFDSDSSASNEFNGRDFQDVNPIVYEEENVFGELGDAQFDMDTYSSE